MIPTALLAPVVCGLISLAKCGPVLFPSMQELEDEIGPQVLKHMGSYHQASEALEELSDFLKVSSERVVHNGPKTRSVQAGGKLGMAKDAMLKVSVYLYKCLKLCFGDGGPKAKSGGGGDGNVEGEDAGGGLGKGTMAKDMGGGKAKKGGDRMAKEV